MAEAEQPFVDHWPMFEEAYSKFPVLADIRTARVKLARRFNRRPLPRETQIDLAWEEHRR